MAARWARETPPHRRNSGIGRCYAKRLGESRFRMTILTNARLVTEDGVVPGTIVYSEEGIEDVQPGLSGLPGAIDAEGDIVAPGLIECHTDNLERHFVPRPGVIWPNPLAALLAHDSQIAASGITSVYDAVCVGGYDDGKDYRPKILANVIGAVAGATADGLLRVDHRLHLRCETTDPGMMARLEMAAEPSIVALASLMDHTPGQRQWRDLRLYRRFVEGEGRGADEVDAIIANQISEGSAAARVNFGRAAAFFHERGIPIASHDDTTPDHVAEAIAVGCTISEFPTTEEAARAAQAAGMMNVGGAPNVTRGGSHSGGVAVGALAASGLIDVLSSDYVPASLLQAVQKLASGHDMPLHRALGLVTWRAADMLGLKDRGRLKPGLRADLLRFRIVADTPLVREVAVQGRRVF
ncbi:alpha-D-ribose 1-methylphosphonate 5-triphosphate diphosphatase [Terrihabitans sp. B22-R8]|uniref:alpha-D-ribose 1-methylphosphonate 5-triphosphate diphosphatase n=1 Tax=Terrihabitans sp. B22-R8 TaxID=3425128 RepID=UPI00403CEFD7